MRAVEKNTILSANKTVFVVHVILAFGVVRITPEICSKRETWIKLSPPVDFSHLTLWKEFELSSDSKLDCVRKCYDAYCSGCGYQTDENKCFLYLNWNNVTSWNPVSTVDYYVPASGGLLEEWSDMRIYGQPFALLIRNVTGNWSEANRFCNSKGGTLFIMNTNERKQAIIDEFQQQGILDGHLWVGLTDQEVEGEWYWLDGSPGKSPNFFKSGEPNNHGNEDCGQLLPTFLLNDYRCNKTLKYICEFAFVL